jgi:hemerythrin-like domain-containing protein
VPLQEGPAEWRTEIARRDAGVGALRDVTEALGWDHDRLEELEARAFEARGNGDFAAARARFGEFAHGLERHIRFEEQILFPAFEERSGIQPEAGPTAVMRAEHREIENLLQAIVAAIGDPASRADGLRQDLPAVLALHNMKEEQVVYPDTDGMLAASERDALVARIQAS